MNTKNFKHEIYWKYEFILIYLCKTMPEECSKMKDLPIFKVIYKHTTFTGYIKYVKLCWNVIQYKEVLKGIIGGKLIKKNN